MMSGGRVISHVLQTILKPPIQFNLNYAGEVLGWDLFKIASNSPGFHPRWPQIPKIKFLQMITLLLLKLS
jgi:hypothetical protein